ncbi:MAG: hypothetical protein ACTS4T_00960 [Candidatus Hodgkinia cicadicola]
MLTFVGPNEFNNLRPNLTFHCNLTTSAEGFPSFKLNVHRSVNLSIYFGSRLS